MNTNSNQSNPDKMSPVGKIRWTFILLGMLLGLVVLWQVIARILFALYVSLARLPENTDGFIDKFVSEVVNYDAGTLGLVVSQSIGFILAIIVAFIILNAFARWMEHIWQGSRKDRSK